MSSHVSRLTRHCQGTPPNTPTLSLLGSLLFGLQLGLLRYPSITHTSNTFVPPIQCDVLLAFVRWQDAPSKESSRRRMGYFDMHPERRRIHLTTKTLDPFTLAAGDIEHLLRRPPTAPIHLARWHLLHRYVLSPNSRPNTFN